MFEGGKHVVEAHGIEPSLDLATTSPKLLVTFRRLSRNSISHLKTDREQLGPDLTSVWVVLSKKVRRAGAISCL